MRAGNIANRIVSSCAAPTLVLALLAVAAGMSARPARDVALVALTLVAIGWIVWLNRTLRSITRRVTGLQGDLAYSPVRAVDDELSRIETQLFSLRHRTLETHPVSGLPLREALIEQVAAAPAGMLGIVALKDVDRLCAFDPALADRVVACCAERLMSMTRDNRFLAQIDRGHIGIWFGNGVSDAAASAELDAVAYALSDEVIDGATRIIPQIAVTLSRYEASAGIEPQAFVARALASYALPPNDPAAPAAPLGAGEQAARAHFTLEQDLRLAIDRRELHLLYQPLVDATHGWVDGAEALIRWNHPQRGPIAPAEFVPMLERIGLADEVGAWALNTAVREAQHWDAIGLPAMRVAVNVSGLQLQGDDLPRFVERALLHHGVGPNRLEIELTESVATSDAAHCRDIFARLRALGVKLAVDDFGTGYSGFSALRTLAFDKIKIDREFVTEVHLRGDCQAICQSIIALGRGLGIRVLAEGVEQFEEFAWLRHHGCQHFQGYYFARPMPASELIDFASNPARLGALLAPPHTVEKVTA